MGRAGRARQGEARQAEAAWRWAERAERGKAMGGAGGQKVGASVGTTRDQAPHAWQKVGRIWQKVGFTITPSGRVSGDSGTPIDRTK